MSSRVEVRLELDDSNGTFNLATWRQWVTGLVLHCQSLTLGSVSHWLRCQCVKLSSDDWYWREITSQVFQDQIKSHYLVLIFPWDTDRVVEWVMLRWRWSSGGWEALDLSRFSIRWANEASSGDSVLWWMDTFTSWLLAFPFSAINWILLTEESGSCGLFNFTSC